jgi:hypothetical protein
MYRADDLQRDHLTVLDLRHPGDAHARHCGDVSLREAKLLPFLGELMSPCLGEQSADRQPSLRGQFGDRGQLPRELATLGSSVTTDWKTATVRLVGLPSLDTCKAVTYCIQICLARPSGR